MAFIEATQPKDSTDEAREMFARQQAKYGYVPNYAKVFGDRADIMNLWADLQTGIREHIDARRFELVTFAAALELKSSYCSLAHFQALERKLISEQEARALAVGDTEVFSEVEQAAMALARKVVADSSSVTKSDIERLRRAGLEEAEIFDVVAVASARAFFAKLVDGLGAEPDISFMEVDEDLRENLVVGRPISDKAATTFDPDESR